jgi:hypothetical protein
MEDIPVLTENIRRKSEEEVNKARRKEARRKIRGRE